MVAVAAIGIAAIAVSVLIAFPSYRQSEKNREQMEVMQNVIENGNPRFYDDSDRLVAL